MQYRNLSEEDWQLFLSWAEIEGWLISFQERRLFQNQWHPYFFALHTDGELQGFVSAVAYKESGWIGNLLVPEAHRGKGYGSALFTFAVDFLRQSQPKRIWLTASKVGEPIYQRRGFEAIDQIERWVTTGTGAEFGSAEHPVEELLELDKQCWGESRTPLLNALCDDGQICRSGNTLGLLQPGVSTWQLGPWLSECKSAQESRQLLLEAIARTSTGKELQADVLVSAELELVLRTAGFKNTGSNQLMVLSAEPVRLNGVLALASFGSVG